MRKSITFLFVFISCCLGASAQVNLDSLWTVWKDTTQPDTTRLKAIHDLAWDGYIYSQPDSAFFFAQLQYDFAKNKGLKKRVAQALDVQGISFWIQGNYDSALDYYNRGLLIKEEMGNKKGIAVTLNNIGGIYVDQGDYATAMDYYFRSLTISEEIGYKPGIDGSLNNIGNTYYYQDDFASALNYYARSLAISEEIMNKKKISSSLNNIGLIYMHQGDSAFNAGNTVLSAEKYTSSMEYYTRSLTLKEEIGNKKGIANSLNNIGDLFYKQNDYATALDYTARSLAINEEIGDQYETASSLINIGKVYFEQGEYASAITYGIRALSISQEIGAVIHTRDAAFALYKAYEVMGRHRPALEMHKLYIATRDSIESEENQREVIRQEYKYEYEKQAITDSVAFAKEQAVSDAELEKSKIQQYALYGGMTLLLAFLLFVYNRYRVTRDQKLIIADQNEEITTALETLKVAQAQLVQSEKMASLGQLTAGIAHEINNPLNFISSSSHALVNDLEDLKKLNYKYREALFDSNISKEEILEFEKSVDIEYLQKALNEEIEGIKEGTRRTSEIVKGLRGFSHEDQVQMEPADIHNGIDVTLNLLHSRISENVRITKSYDQSIEKINCHIGQLNQVFMNLLVNALDAVGEKGEIMITTKRMDDNVMISVKDDGPGIPEEGKDKIFDPFFTTKEVGKGTGLGLSISHGIIKNHGGKIEVKSPPRRQAGPPACKEGEVNKGTEIVITIPIDR